MDSRIPRVIVTPKAAELIRKLEGVHGPLFFHQSGGCCDGSAPMCYVQGDFKVGVHDVRIGEIEGAPFYMSESQFAYWEHTQLILDVVSGRGAGFSLESPHGMRFLTRSRVFDDDELDYLDQVLKGLA